MTSRVAKTGDTMSGPLTLPAIVISSTQPTINLADTTTGRTRYLHHNEDLMGFLKTDGNWDLYLNNNGQMWSANYGWLHDYFFSTTANCVRQLGSGGGNNFGGGNTGNCSPGESNVVNCYGGGSMFGTQFELVDNGSQVYPRNVRYYYNCACNCNCDCCC